MRLIPTESDSDQSFVPYSVYIDFISVKCVLSLFLASLLPLGYFGLNLFPSVDSAIEYRIPPSSVINNTFFSVQFSGIPPGETWALGFRSRHSTHLFSYSCSIDINSVKQALVVPFQYPSAEFSIPERLLLLAANTVECHFEIVSQDPIDFHGISLQLHLQTPSKSFFSSAFRWINIPLSAVLAILPVFLLSKGFFKSFSIILCFLQIIAALSLSFAHRLPPVRDFLISSLLCSLLALALREYGKPVFFAVSIWIYPIVACWIKENFPVLECFLGCIWVVAFSCLIARLRLAESPNVGGSVLAFLLITLYVVVIGWNEMRPTPDPVLFSMVVSLFVLLMTILGWPTGKLGEYSIFTPQEKDERNWLVD
jgi:hypothetical protein